MGVVFPKNDVLSMNYADLVVVFVFSLNHIKEEGVFAGPVATPKGKKT